MQKLLVAATAALILVPAAHAADVAMRVQDVPLGLRSTASAAPAMHFNMLAVHWRGPGTVLVRTHRLHGTWTAWAAADADVAPDGGTGTWHDGDLAWVGASDRVQFRTRGAVRALRSYELWSRVAGAATRGLSEAASPAIVSRAGWHANEEIVRARPVIAPRLKLAVVHHTAGTNSYTPAQAAAIVRGIEVYHVKGNGWNDIGYNFLVDRYGTVYEGRGGGMQRNVVGAHAEGFNTGSVGVALIGNFQAATPPKAMQQALVKLLAWRLDLAHVDPLSKVVYASGGNAKYRAGKVVTVRAISGHRDTGPSECPGNVAWGLLPALTRQVAATGLPKLYAPTAAGAIGSSIRFQARLSSALAWTVAVADAKGVVVATGHGTGPRVDWTWHAPAGATGYVWTISAPGVRPAAGTIGKATLPAAPPSAPAIVSALAVAPGLAAPVAGTPSPIAVRFSLSSAAAAKVQVVGPDGKALTLSSASLPAGPSTVRFDASALADGVYTVRVSAGSSLQTAGLVVDRTLTGLVVSSGAVSPNADGVDDTVTFGFALASAQNVQLAIEQNGAVVATPFAGDLAAGAASIGWDGTWNGSHLPDGAYTAVVSYASPNGTLVQSLPIAVDTTAPVLTSADPKSLVFTLSEAATLTFSIDGGQPFVLPEPAGTFAVPFAGTVNSVSAYAVDAGGNRSATLTG
jgi:flagellar hook assembly protein FlgD